MSTAFYASITTVLLKFQLIVLLIVFKYTSYSKMDQKNLFKGESVTYIQEAKTGDGALTPVERSPDTRKQRIKKALHVNPKLISAKLIMFLIYGGQASIFPFLSVHMKSLGISISEIAVILLLIPILSSIGPTISGTIADKIGNYKLVLIVFLLISILFHLCLWLAVPAFGIITEKLSEETEYELAGNFTGNLTDISTSSAFGDRLTTLSLYFLFRFLSFVSLRGVFPLLDAAILEMSNEHKGDFGVQRLFSSVGYVIFPPLAGWLTGLASKKCSCPDFGPAFYLFGSLLLLGAILMSRMDMKIKPRRSNILRTMGIVLWNPNVIAFLITLFFTGAAWGILLNYLFLFMEDDKDFHFSCPTWMLGLVNTVGYSLGIPIMYFSTELIKLFGHENLLAVGLLCYAGRFIAYSFTYSPYLIYPTEILTAATFLIFVLMPQFAMKIAPKYIGTLVGLFGAANFGLGGGVGPLIGGLLIQWLDYRLAFRILGLSCFVIAVIYLAFYHFFLKRMHIVAKITEGKSTQPESTELQPLDSKHPTK